jgi:sulfotransferase family protein
VRPVFVVGSPRSGTTFFAGAVGSLPGFVDLGELAPLKAAIPALTSASEEDAARELHHVIERVRTLSAVRGRRAVEQTPEMSFLVPAALRAYPQATVVHLIRDGRDVVASLLERGWLSRERSGADDVGAAYGSHTRFWVEPDRREEFARVSDAQRAAWAWRRYLTTAQASSGRTFEIRYEDLVNDKSATAARLAEELGVPTEKVESQLAAASPRSVGRWRDDLTEDQVNDVMREAGDVLRELGYAD